MTAKTNIHFIWFGGTPGVGSPLGQYNPYLTPSRVAKFVQNRFSVTFWNGATDYSPYQYFGSCNVEAVNIAEPHEILHGTPLAEEASRFRSVMSDLIVCKAYAAAKDLFSFAVLYAHGGYFFDTTTWIADAEGQELGARLKAEATGRPRIVSSSNAPKRVLVDEHCADYIRDFAPRQGRFDGGEECPPIDVWAMYSPEVHHHLFQNAILHYLKSAQACGLGVANGTFEGQPTVSYMQKQETQDGMSEAQVEAVGRSRRRRANVIAALAVSSLASALLEFAKQKGVDAESLCWRHEFLPQKERERSNAPPGARQPATIVRRLGIMKVNAGTWR